MLRNLAVAVLLALPVVAQTTPALSVSATADKSTVVSNELLTVTTTITNVSGQAVSDAFLQVAFTRGWLVVDVAAPAGWTCSGGTAALCSAPVIPAGATVAIVASGFAPDPFFGEHTTGTALVRWRQSGTLHSRSATIPVTVNAAATRTDLAMTDSGPDVVRLGESATFTLSPRNAGPADAANVLLYVLLFESTGSRAPAAVSGAGWSCVDRGTLTLCSRARLNAGETAPLTVRVDAPAAPGSTLLHAQILAEQVHDPNPLNSYVSRAVFFGNADDYERVLIPLARSSLPGAGGARWETRIDAFIDSTAPIEIFDECESPVPCLLPPPLPLRKPFDATRHFVGDAPFGRFVAFRRADAAKVHFNIRVRDLSRQTETWGTEIPVVREHELRSGRIILTPLPVDPAFRHTLRIYADAPTGSAVAIRVYGRDDPQPRVTLVRLLTRQPGETTPAMLPRYPAYAELDPIAEAAATLGGIPEAWIEIEPLTPNLRYWAFATVTNNATSHVTTITPQ